MILSLLAIGITAGIAYTWVSRGFFSALLHMMCVLIAGGIAFALWETVSLAIIENAPSGFLAFAGDAAWGIGLIAPFVISLALLRFVVDSVVKANVAVDDTFNYVGGGVCGLVSGVITAGIFVNAVSYMRVPTKFFGYQPVSYGNAGNLQSSANLWVPVDRITGAFYNHLSENVLSTPTPLARYYPDIAVAAGTQRMSDGDGSNRNSIKPDAVSLVSSFTVGKQGGSPDQVLTGFNGLGTQTVAGLDGNPISDPYIAGYVINFGSGAREKFSQIVVSQGQIRLVSESASGERLTSFPIALSSQAKAGTDEIGRYRFDTEGTHIASVGGAAEAPMAVEFAIPRAFEPVALYVKNVRLDIDSAEAREFADAASRDVEIQTGGLLGGNRAENLDTSVATLAQSPQRGNVAGVIVNTRIPREYQLQEGATRGIEINDENLVIGGQQAFAIGELGNRVTRELSVAQFFVTPDTNVVQITLTGDPTQIPSSVLGPAAVSIDNNEAPAVIDTEGRIYPAIGWIYEDRDKVDFRFTPSQPLRAMRDAPGLSSTRADQKMVMLFRVSAGVEIEHFAIGDLVITTYETPITVTRNR